jgi:hypothetical protein
LTNSIVGANCELLVTVKVDSRFRGNDYFRDSRLRGMSNTPPFIVRGEEFGVRIPDSAWDENDARISNHPLAQSPIAPLRHRPITQSPDRSIAPSPDLPIPPAPVTHSPVSVIGRVRWEDEPVY